MRIDLKTALLVVIICLVQLAPVHGETVNLSAAASLREVVEELSDRFSREHPGITFVKNFAGSGTLVRQIENGAPADIVIPASPEWMDYLENRRLVDVATIGVFARNSLVFVGHPAQQVRGMRDLVKLSSIAVGSPNSVPAGKYARQALEKEGLAGQLKGKLVFTRNVREALIYAERGEVDGAFVYRTDAAQARRVRVLFAVPARLHEPVVYPVGLTKKGSGKKAAAAFLAYLHGYEARSLLTRYGFDLE